MKPVEHNAFQRAVWIPALAGLLLILLQLLPINGQLGHDYYHFFSRLYIGAVFFWQNGFAVPHYTPSLCGGIPFFADPQSVYYSLPQFLTFLVDPMVATLATVTVFYALGYLGFLKLGREILGLTPFAAHFGALLFLLNGFSFEHLYVGHITHHSFLLFPWILTFFLQGKRAAPFTLFLCYTFYSGGMHILLVFAAGIAIALPVILARKYQEKRIREWLGFCLRTAFLLVICTSGKLIASHLYSSNFFYRSLDTSDESLRVILTRYFWFNPLTTPLFLRFGNMNFGPWEFVGFVSKAVIPALVVFPVLVLKKYGRKIAVPLAGATLMAVFVALLASGNAFNDSLPFFNHYHNPIKLLGAFIPYLCLISAFVVDRFLTWKTHRLSSSRLGSIVYLLVALVLVAEFEGYAAFFVHDKPARGYPYSPGIYAALKQSHALVPVTHVVPYYHADDLGLTTGFTSLRCYEPLFGYHLEGIKSQLVAGPTSAVKDGSFNLTHPGCFLYPSYFGCQAGDRVKVTDQGNFDLFTHGSPAAWGVPRWQTLLLWLNFISITLVFTNAIAVKPRLLRFSWKPALPLTEGT